VISPGPTAAGATQGSPVTEPAPGGEGLPALGSPHELDVDALAAALGGGSVSGLHRLLGGASRETWAFELDGRPLVLRRDPSGASRRGQMDREGELLRIARAAGVRVPQVFAAGPGWLVMEFVKGETLARRILRDDVYAVARSQLVGNCAQALARLHRGVDPAAVPGLSAEDPVVVLRDTLDEAGEPHPALELGLRWLDQQRPTARPPVVVHGDFRLGNLIVTADGLAAVLDWELAHRGNPVEDLGWLCVRSWRFGSPLPVAGVGDRPELLAAYTAAGGERVDLEELHWWEVLGTLRWAVLCLVQARAHLSGEVRSVELASIGRRVCEVELDLLDLLYELRENAPPPPAAEISLPHDRPTGAELLEAVREFLLGLPLTGRDLFLARVSARALAIVERQLALGPSLAAEHARRLSDLGVATDEELAEGIRGGRFDAEHVLPKVRAAVVAKLRVADPGQLSERPAPAGAVSGQCPSDSSTE